MNRIYLRVPSANCEPSSPCNRYYFADGTMVDLNADVRCGTCKWWDPAVGNLGMCMVLGKPTWDDFGCAKWEPIRVGEDDQATPKTPCASCGGKGYTEQENWHEREVSDCPVCGGTGWADGTKEIGY